MSAEICGATVESGPCTNAATTRIVSGCEHEHLHESASCRSCADRFLVPGVLGYCEICGHPCRIGVREVVSS